MFDPIPNELHQQYLSLDKIPPITGMNFPDINRAFFRYDFSPLAQEFNNNWFDRLAAKLSLGLRPEQIEEQSINLGGMEYKLQYEKFDMPGRYYFVPVLNSLPHIVIDGTGTQTIMGSEKTNIFWNVEIFSVKNLDKEHSIKKTVNYELEQQLGWPIERKIIPSNEEILITFPNPGIDISDRKEVSSSRAYVCVERHLKPIQNPDNISAGLLEEDVWRHELINYDLLDDNGTSLDVAAQTASYDGEIGLSMPNKSATEYYSMDTINMGKSLISQLGGYLLERRLHDITEPHLEWYKGIAKALYAGNKMRDEIKLNSTENITGLDYICENVLNKAKEVCNKSNKGKDMVNGDITIDLINNQLCRSQNIHGMTISFPDIEDVKYQVLIKFQWPVGNVTLLTFYQDGSVKSSVEETFVNQVALVIQRTLSERYKAVAKFWKKNTLSFPYPPGVDSTKYWDVYERFLHGDSLTEAEVKLIKQVERWHESLDIEI